MAFLERKTLLTCAVAGGLYVVYRLALRVYGGTKGKPNPFQAHGWNYHVLKQLCRSESLPLMLVNMDAFDANLAIFAAIARQEKKTIRLATKSVRVPALIKHCLEFQPDVFKGLMCFSVEEAVFLASELDLDDMLIAYPTVQRSDIESAAHLIIDLKKAVYLMVDSVEHVVCLDEMWREVLSSRCVTQSGTTSPAFPLAEEHMLPVCIDVDMSFRIHSLHVGAHRLSHHLF